MHGNGLGSEVILKFTAAFQAKVSNQWKPELRNKCRVMVLANDANYPRVRGECGHVGFGCRVAEQPSIYVPVVKISFASFKKFLRGFGR